MKAIHEAIIPESVFWLAHELVVGRPGLKSRPKADFPLRGVVRCMCGAHMTASYCKGKKNRYIYYHCTAAHRLGIRGATLHEAVEKLLYHLSFSDEQIEMIRKFAREELESVTKYRRLALQFRQSEFKGICDKIAKLEDKMMNDLIEPGTYKAYYARYNAEKASVEREITMLKRKTDALFNRLEEAIPLLSNLRNLYLSCTLEGQQLLLKKVFKWESSGMESDFKHLRSIRGLSITICVSKK